MRLERMSMRDCALEYRAARAKGNRDVADTWLTFALYHREAARAVPIVISTGKTSMAPELLGRMNDLVNAWPKDCDVPRQRRLAPIRERPRLSR